MPIVNRISAYHDDMRGWRQDIHKHPELAYKEHRTAGRVAELLANFGVDEIVECRAKSEASTRSGGNFAALLGKFFPPKQLLI